MTILPHAPSNTTPFCNALHLSQLSYCLSSNAFDGHFIFRVHGFDDKLLKLTEFLLEMFLAFRGGGKELPSFVGEGRFDVIIEMLGRKYDNENMTASAFVTDMRIRYLMPGKPNELSKKKELEGMTVEKFMEVAGKILRNVGIDGLFHGNAALDDVKRCGQMIAGLMKRTSFTGKTTENGNGKGKAGKAGGGLPIKNFPVDVIAKLEVGKTNHLIASSKNECDKNTAVEHYFQVGSDNMEDLVLTDLLVQLIEEPFFDNVRTKEQFGYSVSCSERWTGGIIGFVLRIVSSVKTAVECSSRIDKFLERFLEDILDPMSKEIFLENVVGLAKNKLHAWTTLGEQTGHLFGEITCYRKNFDIKREEVLILKALTKQKVRDFFKEKVLGQSRRALKVQVIGEGGGNKVDRAELENEIKSKAGRVERYSAVYTPC